MRAPSAIFFDVGYTLLRHAYDGPRMVAELIAEEGFSADPGALREAFVEARLDYITHVRGGTDFEASMTKATQFWTDWNARVLERVGVPEARRAALAARINERAWSADSWEPFPETHSTLEALRRRGVRMAIISNFVDTLHSLCALHGLTEYFETIVCSAEVGAMKPEPRIFHLTTRRLGVDPAEVWHVGDSYWADVLGARAAGMVPVLVDRDGILPRPDCLAVRTLDQLPALLDAEAAA